MITAALALLIASPRAQELQAFLRPAEIRIPAPRPAGKPLPDDLARSAARWAHAAQAEALAARNPAPEPSFSFAVIGDVEPGRFPWQRIFAPKGAFPALMKLIHGQDHRLIVQLGDFVSLGTEENYRGYLAGLDEHVRLPMWHVIGNHDRSDPHGEADKGMYQAVFGKTDYFYDFNGARFIMLDTSSDEVRPDQLAWLAAALKVPGPRFIFLHIPPSYLKGKLISPAGVESQDYNGYFSKGVAAFEELVTSAKVERVYMGHIHAMAYADHKGVRYVLTAGGGSPHYPLPPGYPRRKEAHFVRVEVSPSGVRDLVCPREAACFPLPPPPAPRGN